MIELAPRIAVSDAVRFGKPVIAGTRVPVETVIQCLAGGMTVEQVMDEYALTRDDVLAALGYAATILNTEEVRAAP